MTMELEKDEQKAAASGAVPPFDMCSGQWEWTPDSKEAWAQKGLDSKYYHTEPDGSNWVFSYASQMSLSHGQGLAQYAPAAPWDLDPSELEGYDDDGGFDELSEADQAWAEMQGGGGFDMGGMQAALPAQPTTRLSPELTTFLSGLPLNATQCRTLAGVLERSGLQSVRELANMRWSLTQSLGIDFGLASAIAQGLDQY